MIEITKSVIKGALQNSRGAQGKWMDSNGDFKKFQENKDLKEKIGFQQQQILRVGKWVIRNRFQFEIWNEGAKTVYRIQNVEETASHLV